MLERPNCVHDNQYSTSPGCPHDSSGAIGREMTAEKVENYLRRAQEAEDQAKNAKSADLKRRWESAATGWRLMAERLQQRSERG
jgi:hypothetical protein